VHAAFLVAMLPAMLEQYRKQSGWSVGQAARRLGVSVRTYREIKAGARSPNFETWDRICKIYGWPRRSWTF
jgi:transcriptional regulator with XRE-family HTH domain